MNDTPQAIQELTKPEPYVLTPEMRELSIAIVRGDYLDFRLTKIQSMRLRKSLLHMDGTPVFKRKTKSKKKKRKGKRK